MAEKNRCNWVRERISAFLDNEVSSHEAIQMTHHLETCVACRHEYDQTAAVRTRLRALPVVPVSIQTATRERAFARLEQSLRGNTASLPQQRPGFLQSSFWHNLLSGPTLRPLAATLAVAVVAGIGFILWPDEEPVTAVPGTVSAPSAMEWDNMFHQHDAQVVSFSADDPLLRRDAAAEAHASLLRQADDEVTESL